MSIPMKEPSGITIGAPHMSASKLAKMLHVDPFMRAQCPTCSMPVVVASTRPYPSTYGKKGERKYNVLFFCSDECILGFLEEEECAHT